MESVVWFFLTSSNVITLIPTCLKTLTKESNELIQTLPEIIAISTDNFYSKYDVSNSSANLQLIESTVMEYQRNLPNRVNFEVNLGILWY